MKNMKMIKFTNFIKENKVLIAVIMMILALALIGTYIYYVAKAESTTDANFTAIGNINEEVVEATKLGRNLSSELKDINATYSDAVIWLRIPGTVIDTPVFQSTDNERYYRNNRDDEETKWGELYLDYRCDISTMAEKNYIIYGHNTETNDNLSPLLNYKSKNFYKKHKIIELSTKNGNYRFEVFSAYTTDTSFYYIDTDFADANEYKSFLKNISGKSSYSTGVTVSEEDTILTLSTCDYTINNGRYVVSARLIKD